MELKSIKLVGFKSFVDPTTIEIKGNMNSIVGPNGCGKSNVVDAVRWVVGESSAKQLRGQSMSDVIFNGTTSRKPVGKAAVELLFDNMQGRLTGEYAKYNQISVRREVERDGGSSYFINGLLSRRKDIIDLFLGTGLGTRSYGIIEQGMITRLIEAKPDDMRAHLEEVAGISKYKERRKETENRIRHTRDNLDRLHDLTEEINKQLRQLKRQSNAAERYKIFKEEQRLLQAQILALQWEGYEVESQAEKLNLERNQTEQDKNIAEQRRLELEVEELHEKQIAATEAHNAIQKSYYSLGSDIARLEQQLQNHEEQQSQWNAELEEVKSQDTELQSHIVVQKQSISTLSEELATLSPQTESLRSVAAEAADALYEAEEQVKQWRKDFDESSKIVQETEKSIEILRNNISHFDFEIKRLEEQSISLHEEKDDGRITTLNQELNPLRQQITSLEIKNQASQDDINSFNEKVIQQRSINKTENDTLNELRIAFQEHKARHASLTALQQSALGGDDSDRNQWLADHNLDQHPKLGQNIQVSKGWEYAVETILVDFFDAICVDELSSMLETTPSLPKGNILLLEKHQAGSSATLKNIPTLSSVIDSAWSLAQWTHGIYIAETLQQAIQLQLQLDANESIITRDGVWLGRHWCKVSKASSKEDSVLLREQAIQQCQQDIDELATRIAQQEQKLEEGNAFLISLEAKREQSQRALQEGVNELGDIKSELSATESKLQALEQQQQRITKALEDCQSRSLDVSQKQSAAKVELEQLELDWDCQKEKRTALNDSGSELQLQLDQARHKSQQDKQNADEVGIRLSSNENQLRVLQQATEREQRQLEQLTSKKEQLVAKLSATGGPQEDWRIELQEKLNQRIGIEKKLHFAEEDVQTIQDQLKHCEDQKNKIAKKTSEIQAVIQKLQLEQQTITVRQTTLLEQLEKMTLTLQQVKEELPEEADLKDWQQKEEQLDHKISRLGPINLAAIDEYQTQSERKEYLDQQQADLNDALEILEGAISKIDKETKTQFKDTFDKVNASFQQLFPRIFGGGKASLALTENDYLNAGVEIMAQPPGKKNSTIHMLSGGEKALTAISLVFGMFEYNPAPFCILDEVDAPLDDVNVGRFCKLVKEMSSKTQFLVISHNKVTISMADYLMGVTMHEAGVSRLVSVDMEEAIEMTEA